MHDFCVEMLGWIFLWMEFFAVIAEQSISWDRKYEKL